MTGYELMALGVLIGVGAALLAVVVWVLHDLWERRK